MPRRRRLAGAGAGAAASAAAVAAAAIWTPGCAGEAVAAAAAGTTTTSIFKVDFPESGLCGQEDNVTKSRSNPHWFFPMAFGGFREGQCPDVGYSAYLRTESVVMHHHNLTFKLFAPTQTPTVEYSIEDPVRKRVVKMKLCVPMSTDPTRTWPLYIFGHGAGCLAEDYQYFCAVAAVAMIYSDSPVGPIFPADFDTAAAAEDAALVAARLPQLASSDPGSPLHGLLDGTVVLGGHSMGGGTAVLAVGKHGAQPDGLLLFAPGRYTIPDATPFLRNITAPALVVSGSMDCGRNALDREAFPAFEGLASPLKALVVVKGANHCQWTQPFERGLGICSTFSRNECHGISRTEQHLLGERLFRLLATTVSSSSPTEAAASWPSLERELAKGEAEGAWTYISSRSSPPEKRLHNDCPCDSAQDEEGLFV